MTWWSPAFAKRVREKSPEAVPILLCDMRAFPEMARERDFPTISDSDSGCRPAIERGYESLRGDNDGYDPTHTEVAAHAGVATDRVRRTRRSRGCRALG